MKYMMFYKSPGSIEGKTKNAMVEARPDCSTTLAKAACGVSGKKSANTKARIQSPKRCTKSLAPNAFEIRPSPKPVLPASRVVPHLWV